MKFGLRDKTIKKINSVFAEFNQIDEVIVYGSRAKGNYRNGSDIDLTIKGEKLNLHFLNQISLKIDDLLLPYIFDLSIFRQISNQDLIEHIERVGQTFYKRANPA
ncbi:MAG TPA: nucleotidyltransferase domain-containing protein [Sphingobacteriaceae bacterium]|nr:nucleotidyltransferase domain-containing protein [Sphingobacteriaceae bacterium]